MRGKITTSRGFTLIEVLVALTLMGLIMVLAVGAFRIAVHTWQRGDGAVREYEKGRRLYEQLSQDLRSAFLSRESNAETNFVGSSSRVSFVCTTSGLTSFTMAWRRVSYFVEEDKGLVLQEEEPWLAEAGEGEGAPVLHLDPQVKGLSFSYLEPPEEGSEEEEGAWIESWSSQEKHRLPQAVKVTLRYGKEEGANEGEAEGVFSFVVALPVNLLSEENQDRAGE